MAVLPPAEHTLAFVGTHVRTPTFGDLAISSEQGLILVDTRTGAIAAVVDLAPRRGDHATEAARKLFSELPEERVTQLSGAQFLMAGFVDGHAHAPQYAFHGTGLDLPLLDWLERYTFPTESKFKSVEYAQRIYASAVARHLRYGTTTCAYFGTIHREATEELVRQVRVQGQRAHVGKVSMDRNSPPNYVEPNAETAAKEATLFVDNVLASRKRDEPSGTGVGGERPALVTPAVIPRFAPSCTPALMKSLGELSRRGDGTGQKLPIHTHLSENASECAWVCEMHPEASCYADVYQQAGLLHERSYFAHCCHCNPIERGLLKTGGAGVVHCAASNFLVGGALCNVRRWLEEGVPVALGTDVSGGWSASMLDAIRQSIITSNIVSRTPDEDEPTRKWKPLTWQEALYLATQGGANVLGLADVAGALEVGRQFDALLVDVAPSCGGSFCVFDDDDVVTALEKFLFTGDDRHIASVFVAGRRVAGAARGAETTGLVDGGDAVVQNAKMIRERADELTQRPVKKAKQ
jgi:guanine deaminase